MSAHELASPLAIVRETLETMGQDVVGRLPYVGLGLVVFLLSWGVAKLVRSAATHTLTRTANPELGLVIGRIAYFGIVIVGILVALTIIIPSMTPARLVSVFGLGGVAIGFAFKDVFQNLLAGVLLLLRQPFRIGDEISAGEFTGHVEAIETRATFIRTYDGRRVIVPNSRVYTESVSVITAYGRLRSEYDIGIGYGDDVAKAKAIVLDILRGTDGVFTEPAPDVLAWDLAASTLNIRARWWSRPDRPTVVRLRDEILSAIRVRLPEAGIDLPFPTRVVLFHDQTEETDGDRTQQREGWPAGDHPPRPASRNSMVAGSRTHTNGDGTKKQREVTETRS